MFKRAYGATGRLPSGFKKLLVKCMHEGCEPTEGTQPEIKGFVAIWHDEGDDFKLPRGYRFACTSCKEHGPPSERLDLGSRHDHYHNDCVVWGTPDVAYTARPRWI